MNIHIIKTAPTQPENFNGESSLDYIWSSLFIFLYFQLGEELLSESEGRTPPINKYWLGLHHNQNHHQYQYQHQHQHQYQDYHRLNQDYDQVQVQIQVQVQDKLPVPRGPNCRLPPKVLYHQHCLLASATSIVQVQNQIYKYKLTAPNKSVGTAPKWKIVDMHMLLLVIMAPVVVGCTVILSPF